MDCHKQLTLQTDSLAERAVQLTVLNRETQQYRQKVHFAQNNLRSMQDQYQKIRKHAKKLHLKADKAENKASEAGQAKAQFLANMNHELRTPMNAIIGYTEILQEDVEDLGTFEFLPDLQKIHGASYHLLELINNLFNLSRLENAQLELYLEHFDVAPVLQDVASSLQPLLDQQENTLKLELDGALGSMYGDINKVRQNLLNLLSNASKFSKHGNITLSAYRKISGIYSESDTLIFHIVDEGIGMSETQITRLFEAFSKFDSPSAHKHGGAGLGLVLTKHFCDLMGGKIEIESTLGEGTSIAMYLPTDSEKIEKL
jgi:signal transduction histidine kinase